MLRDSPRPEAGFPSEAGPFDPTQAATPAAFRPRETKALARDRRRSQPVDERDAADRGPSSDREQGDGDARARAPGDRPDPTPERREPGKDGEGQAHEGKASDGEGQDEPKEGRLKAAGGFIRKHPIGVGIGAIVLVAAIIAGVLWYLQARLYESTDDAFVDSRAFTLAPKVSGYVSEVLVTDNQHVAAGDIVARIDDRDYVVSVQQAEAQVANAVASVQTADAQLAAGRTQVEEARAQVRQQEATLAFAADENARAVELVQKGAGTLQRAQQTVSQQREAEAGLVRYKASLNSSERQIDVLTAQGKGALASLEQAKAQLAQAKLNLTYTNVVAAQSGRVARLTGGKGQLAQAGTALAMFVPDELWVTANFKETQLTDMRPGQPVDMTIDAYPGRKLTGHVESVQPGSGTVFSLLPAQNATGNYVKVVQRIPVKLVFDSLPTDVTIGPGMSVVPYVKVR